MKDLGPLTEIRPLEGEAERREGFALFRRAMIGLGDLGAADPQAERDYLGSGRMLGGFEGGRLLGVVNGYAAEIALPGGGFLPHWSVTHVSVAPEAKRRGIATRLLTAQLRIARAEGFPLAGLRASDAKIYGRFGYGVASWSVRQELDLTQARLKRSPSGGETRSVDPLEIALFRRIADAEPSPRPAVLRRWEAWWRMQAFRLSHAATPHHAAVFGPPGAERGYLRFHAEPSENWFASERRGVVVDDLVAHDAEAYAGLIGHLLRQDILHRAVFPSRPADDPLLLALEDPRRLAVSGLRDESWIRPLDLEALLKARPYGGSGAVALGLRDPLIPENSGSWRLSPEGPARVAAPPDLEIPLQDWPGLIFGAHSAAELAGAGSLQAPDALIDRLDALLRVSRKPHSGISF